MLSTGIKKTIAFALFWGLGIIILYLFFWRPGIGNLKKAKEDINLKQNVLTQIKKDLEARSKTLTAENLEKAEEELEVLLAQIPPEEDIPGILDHIQKYGSMAAQLNIIGITNVTEEETAQKSDKVEEEPAYAKVTYKLTAEGNFLNIIHFLRGLETAERLIVIEDFDLDRKIDKENAEREKTIQSPVSLDAEVTLSLFYAKPELVNSATDSPKL